MTTGDHAGPTDDVASLPQARLTAAFYDWEQRGRGWQVWPRPVELEPPFRPFFFHAVAAGPLTDDARKPTILSTLAEAVQAWFRRGAPPGAAPGFDEFDFDEPVPDAFEDAEAVVELQVALPPDVKILPAASEQLLVTLSSCMRPLSFEVLGLPQATVFQVACRARDQAHVRQQLEAYVPEATVVEHPAFLAQSWPSSKTPEVRVVDFGLSQEFMRPLQRFGRSDADPLVAITGALTELQPGEAGLVQVLFEPACAPWAESVLRSVTDWRGEDFFLDAPEMVALAREKISRPLFAAVIRVAATSPSAGCAWRIAKALGGALAQFASPSSNELIPLTNDDYPDGDHVADVLRRRSRRSGMLLNSEELVSLVHLPSPAVRSPKLRRDERRTKVAPATAQGHALLLGENRHAGRTQLVSLSPEQRLRHTHIIGASGTGKSTLLLRLIVQDIAHGEGLAVLDPHGDLIDEIVSHVPDERREDVVLVDPSDAEYPIGFNILAAHSELEKTLLSSDLVAGFRRLSTSWGDQMTSVLGNAILAVLESDRGGTLGDLRRFLIEPDFRKTFLTTVGDPEVVYYWQKEFPFLTGRPQAPLLTRLDTFLRPKVIRAMVTQQANRIDFAAIMNEGKILLVKLAQGAIGEENAALLGTLFVAKFHQLALGRQEIQERERRPFHLYIDEFHHFVTPSLATLLTGARKYRLGLILAHQELRQIWNQDRDVASAVLANPATRICFRVSDEDARKLEDGFTSFTARDLQNLRVGEAICRIDRADADFTLTTLPLAPVERAVAVERRERLIASSRARYGTRREESASVPSSTVPPVAAAPPSPPAERRQPTAPVTARTPVREPPERPCSEVPPAASPGRGGAQHKYLQTLIKRCAEDRGYRATIEKEILDGRGSVDVALEKNGRSVACEISITTSVEQEFANVQKCLAAGFEHVVALAVDPKTARALTAQVRAHLDAAQGERVHVLTPEDFILWLDAQEASAAPSEETVRGYKVKVRLQSATDAETKVRKRAIAETVLQALRRLKGP